MNFRETTTGYRPIPAIRSRRRWERQKKILRFKRDRRVDLNYYRLYLRQMEETPYPWEDEVYINRWRRTVYQKAQREVDNPCMCSACCGNPRRTELQRTRQERKHEQLFKLELLEVGCNH